MSEPGRRVSLRALRDDLISLVDDVAPSVVTVRNSDARLSSSSGSGWCFSDGTVVTNAHVVDGDSPIFRLRLQGGALVPAKLVGADPATDLAVLHADAALHPLKVREHAARLGELCFAFGSPLGDFPESVTFGIVSGLNRRLEHADGWSIEGVLQTDAEINPGNSGGPLVDLDGSVLGVNSAIRADGRGVGFAIPSATISSIVPEIIEFGSVARPRLGVTIDVVEHVVDGVNCERLRVCAVATPSESPFQPGDVLVSIADTKVESRADLFQALRRKLIGSLTPVVLERQERLLTVEIRCEA